MGTVKLFDSELRLMELIWAEEPIPAKELHQLATEKIGWNKNTTYTVLKKLVDKGVVLRTEPGFVCTSRIPKAEVARAETDSLIDRLYAGSRRAFFAAFLEEQPLSREEIAELQAMIREKS